MVMMIYPVEGPDGRLYRLEVADDHHGHLVGLHLLSAASQRRGADRLDVRDAFVVVVGKVIDQRVLRRRNIAGRLEVARQPQRDVVLPRSSSSAALPVGWPDSLKNSLNASAVLSVWYAGKRRERARFDPHVEERVARRCSRAFAQVQVQARKENDPPKIVFITWMGIVRRGPAR